MRWNDYISTGKQMKRSCSLLFISSCFLVFIWTVTDVCVRKITRQNENVYVSHRQALHKHCIVLLVKQHRTAPNTVDAGRMNGGGCGRIEGGSQKWNENSVAGELREENDYRQKNKVLVKCSEGASIKMTLVMYVAPFQRGSHGCSDFNTKFRQILP